MLKAFFVLKIFKLLSWLFGHVEKLDNQAYINFKIFDVTDWITHYNTHSSQQLKK